MIVGKIKIRKVEIRFFKRRGGPTLNRHFGKTGRWYFINVYFRFKTYGVAFSK